MSYKNNNYFPALTGARAIAAFMVYIHHFNPFNKIYFGDLLYNFTQELHIGVTLFFVLSGFLIAYRYADLDGFKFKNYIINRIARIYPMYFILTTLTFIVFSDFKLTEFNNQSTIYFLNISFLKGYFDNLKFSGIAQGWSLTVEETFYLIAPLLFFFIKRNKVNLFILPCLVLSLGFLLAYTFSSQIKFYSFFNSFEFMMNYTFFGRCFEFFTGIALAIFFKRQAPQRKSQYLTYIGIVMIIICIFLISMLKGNYDLGMRHPLGKLINTFILPLSGIAVFYYGLLTEKTFISKILASRLFILLGKSSYIFYLIHMGIFASFVQKIFPNHLIIFFVINLLSILMFKYMEEPLNNYIRNKFAK